MKKDRSSSNRIWMKSSIKHHYLDYFNADNAPGKDVKCAEVIGRGLAIQ